ncbi:MAG TPA: DUF4157 domain-containing protein [Pyrinomonadaceae bacterium]|nr:DUF4157 domain-containing protein [Pyrinomonadaceae bacterium]
MTKAVSQKSANKDDASPEREHRGGRAYSSPARSAHDQLLALQRSIGNRGVGQLLQLGPARGEINPGPRVSQPSEIPERQADRVADTVAQGSRLQNEAPRIDSTPTPQKRSETGLIRSIGEAQPLADPLRRSFESSFSHNFSGVRIYAGTRASEAAKAFKARAFTAGQNIVFGAQEYRPETAEGRKLLAHELTHVVQQTRPAQNSIPGREPFSVSQPAPALIQRKDEKDDDWDFTPADFQALTTKKGKLKVSSDSSWFPKPFQDNLIATLGALLDPKRNPSATEGVNVRDFYHGHVVLPGKTYPTFPSAVTEKRDTYNKKKKELYEKALGSERGDVTAENLGKYTEAVKATLPLAGEVLKEVAKLKGAAVIYHTFEAVTPKELLAKGEKLAAGDVRRNHITPLDTNKPVPYSTANSDSAYFSPEYFTVLQFSFLVDAKGEVHIRTNSTDELSTVTGKPPEGF